MSEDELKALVKKAAKAKSEHVTQHPGGNESSNFFSRGE
jgi:hypothetical protein